MFTFTLVSVLEPEVQGLQERLGRISDIKACPFLNQDHLVWSGTITTKQKFGKKFKNLTQNFAIFFKGVRRDREKIPFFKFCSWNSSLHSTLFQNQEGSPKHDTQRSSTTILLLYDIGKYDNRQHSSKSIIQKNLKISINTFSSMVNESI